MLRSLFINSNKVVLYFLSKVLLLYLLWYFLYEQYLQKVGWLDDFLIGNLVYLTERILACFGYIMFVYEHTVGIDGSHGVYIGAPCNGIELMAMFTGMILVFQGSWKKKLWFIPIGIILIHFLNLFRVISLTLIVKYNPETLDFNHKYTFTIILYFIVFCMWMFWIKKLGKIIK